MALNGLIINGYALGFAIIFFLIGLFLPIQEFLLYIAWLTAVTLRCAWVYFKE